MVNELEKLLCYHIAALFDPRENTAHRIFKWNNIDYQLTMHTNHGTMYIICTYPPGKFTVIFGVPLKEGCEVTPYVKYMAEAISNHNKTMNEVSQNE
jgi:hypothetical protein